MVEDTAVDDGGDGVRVVQPARAGDARPRRRRATWSPGDAVFPAGTVLGPAHLGVLTSLGHAAVTVVRRARVGGHLDRRRAGRAREPLAPGQIRDSNRPMLLALVAEAGCEPVDFGIGVDDEAGDHRAAGDGRRHLRRRRHQRRRCRWATTTW